MRSTLLGIWRDVLKVDSLAAEDDFFTLGGDSVQVVRAVAETARRLRCELPIEVFFERPTVAEQAAYLATGAATVADDGIAPVAPAELHATSSAQRRTYVLAERDGGTLYNMPLVFRVEGALDVARLEWGVRALIDRHEALRTSFEVRDGAIVQRVHDDVAFVISVLRASPGEEEQLARAFVRPFDLGVAPLVRVGVIEVAGAAVRLIVDVHHIVGDDVSIAVMLRELQTILAGGDLQPLQIQYKEFAAWQRRRGASAAARRHRDYWRDALSGELPVLALPLDSPRPPERSFAGATLGVDVDAALADQLVELARREGATTYMLLLASYAVLLHRYTRQDDLIIGSPVTERTAPELERLVGMFVNTVALRLRPRADQTFTSFLREVKERCLEAFEHREVPFEELVGALHAGGDPSRNPIFDTMFSLLALDDAPIALPGGARLTPSAADEGRTAHFDLTLRATLLASGMRLECDYAVALFHGPTIERMLGHLMRLLGEIARDPQQTLGDLELLSPEERHQVVEAFNRTSVPYPGERSVVALFEEVVRRTPEAIAIVDAAERTLTYRELDRRANQVAHRLVERGIGHDDLVGIVAERSTDLVVGLLGILKASAAYLPIDPGYPAERVRYMVEDGGLSVVLVQGGLAFSVETCCEIIDLADAALAGCEADRPLAPASGPASLAYVMYTSGSTGRPKGVMIEHRGIVRLVCGADYLPCEPGDKLLLTASPSFDGATFELWGALLHGMELHIVDSDTRLDAERLAQALARRSITTLQLTTALFHHLAGQKPDAFRTLRQLYIGGDALSAAHAERVRRACPGTRICNVYGPTENTTNSTFFWVEQPWAGRVPIGAPISNARAFVVDERLRPVPIGVIGELVVAGDGLARGYWRRPELTAEKFVTSPHLPGERLYRTGDLARWRPGGLIDFLGRVDHQIKIRGYRIETGEIEATLRLHPGVADAVVVSVGGGALAAYIVAGAGAASAAELRDFVAGRLPDYMVPAHVVALAVLPLTAGGKLDRKALPPIAPAGDASTYLAPASDVEVRLARIWKDVLGTEGAPGIDDDFFRAGGHSLAAMLVAGRLRAELGVELPLREIMARPTIRQLARWVGAAPIADGPTAQTCLIPLKAGGGGAPVFFVPGVFGSVAYLSALARALPAERPLYAFQAPGLDGGRPLESVAEIAEHYWQALRALRPQGPYVVAGHSFGATVAYALARRIVRSGAAVEHLLLLDGLAPTPSAAPDERDREFVLSSFAAALGCFLGGEAQVGSAALQGVTDQDAMVVIRARLEAAGLLHAGLDLQMLGRLFAVFQANLRAVFDGEGSLAVRATLIKAADESPGGTGAAHGWDALFATRLEVMSSPGDHFSMLMAPAVAELAELIEQRIRGGGGA